MALKASVEPMLINDRRSVTKVVNRTALTGILDLGLTVENHAENGSALSRAKAKVCREHVAKILMALQTSRMRIRDASAVAPPLLPRALVYAETKANPLSGARTVSRSPSVNR